MTTPSPTPAPEYASEREAIEAAQGYIRSIAPQRPGAVRSTYLNVLDILGDHLSRVRHAASEHPAQAKAGDREHMYNNPRPDIAQCGVLFTSCPNCRHTFDLPNLHARICSDADRIKALDAERNALKAQVAAQLAELHAISNALGTNEGHSSVDHIIALKAKLNGPLPCDVRLSPRTTIKAGCPIGTPLPAPPQVEVTDAMIEAGASAIMQSRGLINGPGHRERREAESCIRAALSAAKGGRQ